MHIYIYLRVAVRALRILYFLGLRPPYSAAAARRSALKWRTLEAAIYWNWISPENTSGDASVGRVSLSCSVYGPGGQLCASRKSRETRRVITRVKWRRSRGSHTAIGNIYSWWTWDYLYYFSNIFNLLIIWCNACAVRVGSIKRCWCTLFASSWRPFRAVRLERTDDASGQFHKSSIWISRDGRYSDVAGDGSKSPTYE